MNTFANSLVDSTVQCWGCPVFDRLFQIVSASAAAVYNRMAIFCAVIFCVLFAFFVLNAVWQNIKGGVTDSWYKKSLQPVFINSLVAMTLLSMGVALPRFMTQITFEPTAQIALGYTQSMLHTNNEIVAEKVTYQPMEMPDDGFYRPQMRNTIIMLMKTTITQFQSYIKLGIAVMDHAFSWDALLGIGALIKHIVLFFIGMALAWGFFKLFAYFCFYFADIIIAMMKFAFFFPLSLIMVSFKNASNVPKWMSGLGAKFGTGQIKDLINAIISLASAVITYTVMMVIIAKFFSAYGTSADGLMQIIIANPENLFTADFSDDNLATMTLASAVVLVYVLTFIYGQIPQVTKMILSAFDVSENHAVGDQIANDAMRLTSLAVQGAKKVGQIIASGGDSAKKDDGTEGGKK